MHSGEILLPAEPMGGLRSQDLGYRLGFCACGNCSCVLGSVNPQVAVPRSFRAPWNSLQDTSHLAPVAPEFASPRGRCAHPEIHALHLSAAGFGARCWDPVLGVCGSAGRCN